MRRLCKRDRFKYVLIGLIGILLFVNIIFLFVLRRDIHKQDELMDQTFQLKILKAEINQYEELIEEYRSVSSENQSLIDKKEELQNTINELILKKDELNRDIAKLNRLIKEG